MTISLFVIGHAVQAQISENHNLEESDFRECELVLSERQMQEDIDYYFNTLKECHPNLYARYSPAVFDSVKLNLKGLCRDSMSTERFNYLLAKTAKYVDGHTGGYAEELIYPYKAMLPFVTIDDQNNLFIEGKKVLSINGVSGIQIGKDVDQLISWENSPLQRNNDAYINLSSVLFYGYNMNSSFINIELLDNETNLSETSHVELNSETKDVSELIAISQKKFFGKSDVHSNWFLKRVFKEDSLAVLYYNDASLMSFTDDYDEAMSVFTDSISAFFDEIRGCKYLFIDVSQNDGGNDLTNSVILKFLTYNGGALQMTTTAQKNGAVRVYESYKDGLENSEEGIEWLQKIVKPLLEKGQIVDSVKVEPNSGFEGKVFIIMSPNTYSAGFDFCLNAKMFNVGTLVGMPAGQRSPYCGNVVYDNLPNSNIEFMFPTTYSIIEPKITDEDGFLQPDISYLLNHTLKLDDFKKIIEMNNKRF